VLSRLVNMQFVHRDAGRYYLHQVDRDYALSRIAKGGPGDRDAEVPPLTRYALQHRAAEWFKLSRKPREAWKSLDDLAAQLSEFELRLAGDDYDTAAAVLLEFDFGYLFLWGHARLMTDLHERLQGKITDPALAQISVGDLGSAYYRMGQAQRAISLYEKALQLARDHNDRENEGTWLSNVAVCLIDLGENERANEYLEQALAIRREVGDRKGEAQDLGNLAIRYSVMGQNARAVQYGEQALQIDREIKYRKGEAEDLVNLSDFYRLLGRPDEALRCVTEGLAIAHDIGYRFFEATACEYMAAVHVSQDNWSEAARELEQAIEIADNIGAPQISKQARETFALVNVYRSNLAAARELVEAARKYDVPLSNHSTLALLGVVALRQADLSTAREAFTLAINEASQLIASTADRYETLDVKGLSLCGLVLCGDPAQISAAKAAYSAARAVASEAGITRAVLQRFDALAQADTDGILADVRPVAAGVKPESRPPIYKQNFCA